MKDYRKFVVVILVLAIAAFRPLTDAQAEVIIWIGLAFITGNAIEHVKEMATSIRGRGRAVPPITVATDPAESGDKGNSV